MTFINFMQKITKLTFIFVLSIGVVLFIISVLGANVYFYIGNINLTGRPAGLAILLVTPFLGIFFGLLFSIVYYYPYIFYKKLSNKFLQKRN